MSKAERPKAQVPQHQEKSGREIGREARHTAIMNEIGPCSSVVACPTPAPNPPSRLAAAIQAVKG